MERERIKYYSPQDMSCSWNLRAAEAFFSDWEKNIAEPDINTILELYNIKQYFDTDLRLEQWTDAQYAEYKRRCKSIPRILNAFCNTITDANLEMIYQNVDCDYTDDFWLLICDYKVHQRISTDLISRLMASNESIVWEILQQSGLSKAFGQAIAEHLQHNSHTAEKLITQYLAAHEFGFIQLFFPAEFTPDMRDKVLMDYIERDDANINSLQLLAQAQSSREFPVSDRLRLKARRKKDELQERLFAGSARMTFGANVAFKSMPDSPMEHALKDGIIHCTYSREWIEENQDYPTLLNNFIYLFRYVDRCYRCMFVSRQCDMSVMERCIGVKGKKDYEAGTVFKTKQMLSTAQMAAYNQELQRLNIRLEDIFQWFFEDYLLHEFDAKGFTYSPPSFGTTYAEKCKLLSSAIDGVLKQYRLFCEDGYIDRELLEMSSGHIAFDSLVSSMSGKYGYPNSNAIRSEMFLLFSDQSTMNYTKKTKSKYKTLPDLLQSEKMRKDDFTPYQQLRLDYLLERQAIHVTDAGFLAINPERVAVLNDLFHNEVICPTYYGNDLRQEVEALVATGDMCYENTLFSRPEQKYLNYMLNKSEFSNGEDLRNKYSHDTYPLDEIMQCQDYHELLKIMVLIITKINEELLS